MARRVVRTRDGVEIVTRTDPDGRETIESFHLVLFEQLREAGLVQLRVVTEEARELILDKLYSARAQRPGRARLERPPVLRRRRITRAERRPYRHPRLAERTVRDKAAAEQDGRKLIATGEYTYGIEIRKGQRGRTVFYTIRPKPGKHPTAEVTHRILAAFHEFGTSRMPARPHWGPALRVVKRVLAEQADDVRAVALRQALRAVR